MRDKNFWGSFVSGTVSHVVGHNIRGLGGKTQAGFMLRTGIVSASSAIVASATGGDAMQTAMTAALVHMFNTENVRKKRVRASVLKGTIEADIIDFLSSKLSLDSVELMLILVLPKYCMIRMVIT